MKYTPHHQRCSYEDMAVSEIIGSIMLITIVVVAVSVIGVLLLSQPTPEKLPALDAVISADASQHMIHIYHDGGDLLSAENIDILVDGTPTSFTKSGASGWTTFSLGESLDAPYTGNLPGTVQIVYTRGGGSTILASANFANEPGKGGSPTPTSTVTTSTTTTPVPISPVVANFIGTPTSGLVPLNVTFADASSGPVISWSWTFGDGGVSALQNPSHQYGTAGNYTVSLTVSNGTASDTLTLVNYISVSTPVVPVVAGFTGAPVSGYLPLAVQFTDQSTGPVTRWDWTFGDGNISSVQNPQYTYPNAGNYTVTLTVKNDSSGVTSTVTKANYIQVLSFAQYVIDENVFVYGSKLYFQGSHVIGPGSTVILTGTSVTTGDFNSGAEIEVSNIYVDGDVALNSGSASWGSSTDPGAIYVNGDLTLLSGGRNFYGDIYVAGDFNAKDPKIHGNVYVNGDVTLGWTPTLDTNSRIYYTGALTVPSNYDAGILSKCIHQSTVPGFTMPDLVMAPVKSAEWYAANGYTSAGTLTSSMKIFATSYSSTSWQSSATNVVIVASNGDITLTGLGGSGVTGVLYAPKGKVTFNGGSFEGVVIARDGFYVTSGGTTVTFRNLDEYISDPDNYPF